MRTTRFKRVLSGASNKLQGGTRFRMLRAQFWTLAQSKYISEGTQKWTLLGSKVVPPGGSDATWDPELAQVHVTDPASFLPPETKIKVQVSAK